jgi:hypothetical protein
MRIHWRWAVSAPIALFLVALAAPAWACPDNDNDGICNNKDSCPGDAQNDVDGDGVCAGTGFASPKTGDHDNCPTVANASQTNGDGDALGDACDACSGDNQNDVDGDGICAGTGFASPKTGDHDNCPAVANPSQSNVDQDSLGDACDTCPGDAQNDVDGDGICAGTGFASPKTGDHDNCPTTSNAAQGDHDGDLVGDACDGWVNCGEYVAQNPAAPVLPAVRIPTSYGDGPDGVNLVPPAKGGTFYDPTFNCPVRRVTDGETVETTNGQPLGVTHDYSSPSPFNSDSTLVIVFRGSPLGALVEDLYGHIVCDPPQTVPINGTTEKIFQWMEPRWSATDPHTFYFHSQISFNPGPYSLYAFNVSTCQVIGTLYGPSSDPITFGGEGDVATDGDRIAVHLGTDASRSWHLFDLTTSPVTIHPELIDATGGMMGVSGWAVNWCDMMPAPGTHKMVCRIDHDPQQAVVEIYDGDTGGFIRRVLPWAGHSDRALAPDGTELLLITNNGDSQFSHPAGCYPGVEKVNLWTSAQSCLMPTGWEALHVSASSGPTGHGWAVVSRYDHVLPGIRGLVLDPNWQSLWAPNDNEIVMLSLDGKQQFRLTHHRARWTEHDWYYSTPRAAISRDGQKVLFDSNFAKQPSDDYHDVYLISAAWIDTDRDGIYDFIDNCPSVSNANQADLDWDGVGNVCDNCIDHWNPTQTDSDHDGLGDACEGLFAQCDPYCQGEESGCTFNYYGPGNCCHYACGGMPSCSAPDPLPGNICQ